MNRAETLSQVQRQGRNALEQLDYQFTVKQVKLTVPFILAFEEMDELRSIVCGYDWKIKFRLSLNQKKKVQSTVVILERIEKIKEKMEKLKNFLKKHLKLLDFWCFLLYNNSVKWTTFYKIKRPDALVSALARRII